MTEPPPLRISDHALVRYMERIKGIDLDGHRDELRALAAAHTSALVLAPVEIKTNAEGLTIVIDVLGTPIVTTVLGPGQRAKRQRFGVQLIYVPSLPKPPIP